jgi:hypothetical protein
MRSISILGFVALVLSAPAARAVDGFTFGLEYGHGSWSAGDTLTTSDLLGPIEVGAYMNRVTEAPRNGVHLHLGWNVLGHALIEGTVQTSFWSPFTADGRGGVGLVGGRLTWMPLELAAQLLHNDAGTVLKERFYDLGLEFGAGYSLGGAKLASNFTRGMGGVYLSYGVTAEVWHPKARFVSLVVGWRYFDAAWDTFYRNYDDDVKFGVSDFSAGWNTFTLGLSFHAGAN